MPFGPYSIARVVEGDHPSLGRAVSGIPERLGTIGRRNVGNRAFALGFHIWQEERVNM